MIRLRATVGTQTMLLLVDSASTQSFVNSTFVKRIAANTLPIPVVLVSVANGHRLKCDQMAPKMHWLAQGHEFATDMQGLDFGVYDGVLRIDWLAAHSPMQCNWLLNTMEFEHDGHDAVVGVCDGEPVTIIVLDA